MTKCTLIILASFIFLQKNTQAQSTHSKDSLIVSFISVGTGTDYKAKEKLEAYVKEFENDHHVKLEVSIKHWGREGETDYIYSLQKLSRKDCKVFIEEIKMMFSKNNLVKISHHDVD
jgi:hypothetical protein